MEPTNFGLIIARDVATRRTFAITSVSTNFSLMIACDSPDRNALLINVLGDDIREPLSPHRFHYGVKWGKCR